MIVPLRKRGNPIIQNTSDVMWNGSQCILIAEKTAITVQPGDLAVVLVVSFRKD